MVIGDSDIGQHSPAQLLRQKKFCVLTAATVEESLDLLHRFTDQLVVVIDVEVSRIEARAAWTSIQRNRPHTPVLLISGQIKPLDKSIPGAYVLRKPFRPDQFFAALEECCLGGKAYS